MGALRTYLQVFFVIASLLLTTNNRYMNYLSNIFQSGEGMDSDWLRDSVHDSVQDILTYCPHFL
jgi:hypothetical protein